METLLALPVTFKDVNEIQLINLKLKYGNTCGCIYMYIYMYAYICIY